MCSCSPTVLVSSIITHLTSIKSTYYLWEEISRASQACFYIYIYMMSYKLEACNYALFLLIVAVVKASVVHTAAENATFPTLDWPEWGLHTMSQYPNPRLKMKVLSEQPQHFSCLALVEDLLLYRLWQAEPSVTKTAINAAYEWSRAILIL